MKKEVIFILLDNYADWKGAFIATCQNQGIKSESICKYTLITKHTITSIGEFKTLPDHIIHTLPDNHIGNRYTNEARYVPVQAIRDSNIVTANGVGLVEFYREVPYT